MKKIVLSKLREYNAYYKIGSARFQDKRFGRVYMNKKWDRCERNFQKLKNIISFSSPQKKVDPS